MRRGPVGRHAIPGAIEVRDDVREILLNELRQHFKATQLKKPETPGRNIGRVEFVDAKRGVRVAGNILQNMAEDAVDQPLAEGYL